MTEIENPDAIAHLPTDNLPPTEEEEQLLHLIFDKKQRVNYFMGNLKYPLMMGLMFFVLSLGPLDVILRNCIPYTKKNPLSLKVLKTILFIIGVFILGNSHLI